MPVNGSHAATQPGLAPPSAPLPGARAALILLLSINLFNYIDRQMLAAMVPKIRSDLHAELPASLQRFFGTNPENALIGLLAMAFMVTYMFAAPLFGWLAERRPRWVLIGIGVIVWSLASGASGLATTFGILLMTRCLLGIGEGAYGPVAPDMISDLYPVKIRGRVLSWFYMAIPVGSALGYVIGGKIAETSLGWQGAFRLVVPPGILLGILCFFMKEPRRGQADLAQPEPNALANGEGKISASAEQSRPVAATNLRRMRWADYWTVLKTPSYLLNTFGMTAMTFALGGIGFWMPAYIHEVRKAGELGNVNFIFGAIVVVAGLSATLLGGIAGDKLRDRFPGSYFLVSGAAMLVGFPLSIAMLYVPFPWAWIFIFLACFCLFFNTGPTNTILANVTHPAMRASGYALNILIIHAFGDVISPLVIGAITDATGNMSIAFLVVSGMIFLGGLIWLWGARYLERDTALAPTRLSSETNGGIA
ncbi:MAG TPA: MFS transporter [Gemmataceae bacterium]|nr:MFS transporter [Gemmataceae bacterium]